MAHQENGHAGAGHVSTGKYVVGFILAVVLTVISFAIVAAKVAPPSFAIIALVVAAVAQIVVHLHYFLHLDLSKENQWNFISIAFTGLILLIFILGTVWVIFTLNSRLMVM